MATLFISSALTRTVLICAGVAGLLASPTALAAPDVHLVLGTQQQLKPGEYLWDPQFGPNGPVEIVVDLSAERIYVYRGGAEIGRSPIIYGDDKPTPTGEFTVLEKDIDHVSNIYHVPMPYMLRLTWNGISIHGSGGAVDNRYATHGCIGVSDDFAALLFQMAPKGARVTITRNWMPEVYKH